MMSVYPIQPHQEWLALGPDTASRRKYHAELVASGLTQDELERIRYATQKGLPTGSDQFKAEIEAALATRLHFNSR